MKQIITISILVSVSIVLISMISLIIIGCSNNTKAQSSGNNSTCVYVDGDLCQVHIIKVQGHEYLVSYTTSSHGGTHIIHAAHCPCNNH